LIIGPAFAIFGLSTDSPLGNQPMPRERNKRLRIAAPLLAAFLLTTGCKDDGGGISNPYPGDNDVSVVCAFGDELTSGFGDGAPYPAKLEDKIGQTVRNSGRAGTTAAGGVARIQSTLSDIKPGFVLILYGINDVLQSSRTTTILAAIEEMVITSKQNSVVPVLATYPVPNREYQVYAYNTVQLNRGIRDLAESYGIHCIDLEKLFSNGMDPANPDLPLPIYAYYIDGIRPSEQGTDIMANAFAGLF
jgi:lysophospholipase L1-like esterase